MMTLGQRKLFAADLRLYALVNKPFRVAYEPGDHTHYDFMLCPVSMSPVFSSGDRAVSRLEVGRWIMADAAVTFRAMTVDLTLGHYTDPSYLLDKQFTGRGGAAVVAELLNLINAVPDELLAGMRSAWPCDLW